MSHPPAEARYGSTQQATTSTTTNPSFQYDHDDSRFESDGIHREDHPIDNDDNENDDDDDAYEMSLTELRYSSASYHAIVKPVTLTMTLAALSVVFINTEDTIAQGEAEMAQAYQVFDVTNTANNHNAATQLELSLVNAFLLVCGICLMTFVIVALYKFKCMTFLLAYMMFASSSLLGVLGGVMWNTAIQIYKWPVDKLTFVLGLWNFCIVGVFSIFYQKGAPTAITQAYLIATSVILAWQLAHFDAWSTWTLLIMLALYDLCAVLTPCGPLKALVNLMSQDDAPDMPGLLYEAELPPEARRPGVPTTSPAATTTSSSTTNATTTAATTPTPHNRRPHHHKHTRADDSIEAQRSVIPDDVPMTTSSMEDESSAPSTVAVDDLQVTIPLAMARVYNLEIVQHGSRNTSTTPAAVSSTTRGTPLLSDDEPTRAQLLSPVVVHLPPTGGRLEPIDVQRRVYLERNRFGTPKRTVWVDSQGKVFADPYQEGDEDPLKRNRGNTIRLGLGDFIFYSVLVAKAAQYSFATFIACWLVILAGLGGTLVLLSVYHQALPALPISIFLGVAFYLVTRGLIEPWIEAVLRKPYYV